MLQLLLCLLKVKCSMNILLLKSGAIEADTTLKVLCEGVAAE